MITIREINKDNVFDICELTSNMDGVGTLFEAFICCNAISITESNYFPEFQPRAIYLDDVPIGFFMYKHYENRQNEVEGCRFMLDYKFRGKGLGKEAFQAIMDYFKGNNIQKVILMIDADNHIAKKLYLSFGFTSTGEIKKDEHYYSLTL